MKLRTNKHAPKILALAAIITLIAAGCSSTGNKDHTEIEQSLVENARANVNWPGTYQGMLPCAGACDGIATMIVLYPDNRFTLRTRKMGIDIKDKINEGRVSWHQGGSELSLIAEEPLPTSINHIRVNRDSLSLYQQPATAEMKPAPVELDKTGAVPIPPPTI
ncbi:copper resistance protein NlpE N-terminal domain-containing protein [Cardiobacteriaceae bacterium TAE3-ERU3]|nr:copper resistance protein NlpE N-terminal domain-containing protein [Cardiobacteriaceae bacterium TAE3-ERU3]